MHIQMKSRVRLCYTRSSLLPPRCVAQGHDQSSTLPQHTAELTLPKHSPLHRDLLRYAKLMEWLKNTHREKYEGLSRVSGATRNTFRATVAIIVLLFVCCDDKTNVACPLLLLPLRRTWTT